MYYDDDVFKWYIFTPPHWYIFRLPFAIDRDTGAQKPFGFVEMSSEDEAEQAISQLSCTYLKDQELAIDYQDANRSKGNSRSGNRFSSGGYGRERSQGYSNRW